MILKRFKNWLPAIDKLEEVTSNQPDNQPPKAIAMPESNDTGKNIRLVQVSINDVVKISLVLYCFDCLSYVAWDIAFILLLSYLFSAARSLG